MGNPQGFIPTGTGPKGERFGRDAATGLAFKADGTTRQKRRTFSATERMARLAATARQAMSGIGRSWLKSQPSYAAIAANVGTFRKWNRDAQAYSTPEKCAEREAYHRAMLAAIAGKHKAAKAWLPGATAAITAIDGLQAKAGEAFATFRTKEGRDPDTTEGAAILARFLTPDVVRTIGTAADPANDPFAEYRRDAAEPDTATDDDDEDLADEAGDESEND